MADLLRTQVAEWINLGEEARRMSKEVKKLRDRRIEIERKIVEYLQDQGNQGVKFHGKTITVDNRNRRLPKKKKERARDATAVLEQGFHEQMNPQEVVGSILEAWRGEKIEEARLRMKSTKKKKEFFL